jgi:hypothetical protein
VVAGSGGKGRTVCVCVYASALKCVVCYAVSLLLSLNVAVCMSCEYIREKNLLSLLVIPLAGDTL